jgi:type IV pilus assembly protein PilW
MKPVRSMRKVRGITLIEILISMTIGLVVVGAVIVSFVGSGNASRYQSALTQMNQDAQIALNMLSREVQLAGYAAPATLTGSPRVVRYHSLSAVAGDVTETKGYIFGCDGGTYGVGPFTAPTAEPLTCSATVGTASSGLAVSYEADAMNTAPTSTGIPTDCLGARIGPQQDNVDNIPYYVARNRYFVGVDASSGRRELYCAVPASPNPAFPAPTVNVAPYPSPQNATGNQPLVENVQDMQIWYGMRALPLVADDRQVINYMQATAINVLASADKWNAVISVRICLLMRSAEPVLKGEDDRTYQPCDQAAARATSPDNRLYRAYYTTSTLRSKMPL